MSSTWKHVEGSVTGSSPPGNGARGRGALRPEEATSVRHARGGAVPLSIARGQRRIWGVPVEPAWWQRESENPERRDALLRLCEPHSDLDGGPGAFAAQVAAAVEQVAAWEATGVAIRGRSWVDLGGGDGYHALALRLAGATRVTLVDEDAPGPWALPVLEAAGIEVVVGDAKRSGIRAEAACLLYVPGIGPFELLEASPSLRAFVTNEEPDERELALARRRGWEIRRVPCSAIFLLGEGCATLAPPGGDGEPLWVATGPRSFSGGAG